MGEGDGWVCLCVRPQKKSQQGPPELLEPLVINAAGELKWKI